MGQELPEDDEEEVGLQVSLVHLIHQHVAHPLQLRVRLHPTKQDARGAEQQARAGAPALQSHGHKGGEEKDKRAWIPLDERQ